MTATPADTLRFRRHKGATLSAMLALSLLGSTSIRAGAAGPAPRATTVAPQGIVEISDRKSYSRGHWLAWLEPWGAGNLLPDKDYSESMKIVPETFPARSLISWSWPETPAPGGVYNFLAINYGNSYNTRVPVPVSPRRAGEIAELTHAHDLSLGGNPADYNVIVDFWLTKEASRHDVHLFEVEVFLHASDAGKAYAAWATRVGDFTDASGRLWQVSIDRTRPAPDILFMPPSDIVKGSVDLRAMLRWLIEAGVITGKEWFNGLGTGVEVVRSRGTLEVGALSVSYR